MIAQADYETVFNRSFAEFYSQAFPIPATPWYHYTNGNGSLRSDLAKGFNAALIGNVVELSRI